MRKLRRDRLHRQAATAVSLAITTPSPLFSSRSLDLVSLALCSCALTLLCHSATTPPASSTTAGSTMTPLSAPLQRPRVTLQTFTLPASRPTLESDKEQE